MAFLRSFGIFAFVVLSSLAAVPSVEALTVKIVAQTEQCFTESVPAGGLVNFAFTVTHGGKLDVDGTFYATLMENDVLPTGEQASGLTTFQPASYNAGRQEQSIVTKRVDITSWKLASDGHGEYRVPKKYSSGAKVTACFSNKMARWTPKWVSFEFYRMPEHMVHHEEEAAPVDAANSAVTDDVMEQTLHDYANQVYNMRQLKQTMRKLEEAHRDKVESTNSWLLWGGIVESVLLVVMALFQFWYLRKFLSVRGFIRTV